MADPAHGGSILINANGVVGLNGLNLSMNNQVKPLKQKNKNYGQQVKNKYGISGTTTQQIN